MNLSTHIKSKGKIANYIPVIGNSTSQSIYPFIFLSKKIYDDLKNESPSPKSIAHLIHEETHFKRQKDNPFVFHLKYFISPKFRFEEELIATIEQMKVYKKYKLDFEIERRAKALSGPLYLWSSTYKRAKEELEKAWVAE